MGQAKKNRRPCPAVGRPIPVVECCDCRVSKYPCPASCEFNPFGPENYPWLREILSETAKLIGERLGSHPQGKRFEETRAAFFGMPSKIDYLFAMALLREPDTAGRSFLGAWESEKFLGLTNDGKVLAAHSLQLRPALLEIVQIVDTERFLAHDLLTPNGPLLEFHDVAICARGTQFSTFLGWIHPLPHYWIFWGMMTPLASLPDRPPRAAFDAMTAHLGYAGDTEAALREWIWKEYFRLAAGMEALETARQRRMSERVETSVIKKYSYRLCAEVDGLVERLTQLPEVVKQPDGEGTSWLWLATAPRPDGKYGVIRGWIELSGTALKLCTIHLGLAELLRARFEYFAGDIMEFEEEKTTGLGPGTMPLAVADEGLVPPELLGTEGFQLGTHTVPLPLGSAEADEPNPAELAETVMESWLDSPEALLDGLTPRGAAADPALRPRVAQLLRHGIATADRSRVRGESYFDYTPAAAALGFADLRHHVPEGWVYEATTGEEEIDEDWEEEEDEFTPPDCSGWPEHLQEERLGEVDPAPLDNGEIHRRVKALPKLGVTQLDRDIAMQQHPDFFHLVDQLLPHEAGPATYAQVMAAYLVHARLLCGPGQLRYGFDWEAAVNRFFARLDKLDRAFARPDDEAFTRELKEGSRQPEIAQLVGVQLIGAMFEGPKEERIDERFLPTALAMVLSALDELDACVCAWREDHE